jgi:hypothetical protein
MNTVAAATEMAAAAVVMATLTPKKYEMSIILPILEIVFYLALFALPGGAILVVLFRKFRRTWWNKPKETYK